MAVDFDKKNQTREAIRYYERANQLFASAIEAGGVQEPLLGSVRERQKVYGERAGALRALSMKQSDPSVQVKSLYFGEKGRLQLGLDLAEVAKQADVFGAYRLAVSYYQASLQCFIRELRVETNKQIRQSITEAAQVYMARAEKLKGFLGEEPGFADPELAPELAALVARMPPSIVDEDMGSSSAPTAATVAAPSSPSSSFSMASSSSSSSSPSGITAATTANTKAKGLTGPSWDQWDWVQSPEEGFVEVKAPSLAAVTRSDSTTGLLRKAPVTLEVTMEEPSARPGDVVELTVHIENHTHKEIRHIQVALRENIVTRDAAGDARRRGSVLHEDEYVQGNVFPLPGNIPYTGVLKYRVLNAVKPSDRSNAEVFSREHELVVTIEVANHKNPKVVLPITIL